METCCRYITRTPALGLVTQRVVIGNARQVLGKRMFHDYWVQKTPAGVSMRIPILKARHHLGALTSRGNRAENEDRFKVGLMNKLSPVDERQPFYFAIIDGYDFFKKLAKVDMEGMYVRIMSSTNSIPISKMPLPQKQKQLWMPGGRISVDISDAFILEFWMSYWTTLIWTVCQLSNVSHSVSSKPISLS